MDIIRLEAAEKKDVMELTAISKRAFDSDTEVGAPGLGGPPGYDSTSFQERFMGFLDYYKIMLGENIVGGLLVTARGKHHRVLERIFIDPPFHNKGLASRAMTLLWKRYPQVQFWTLGTPDWNKRTQNFYKKHGFVQVGWEVGPFDWRGIWYQKALTTSSPFILQKIHDLTEGLKDINVEGVVHSISSPKEVISRSTGKRLSVAHAELRDTTGNITLVLWNEQISQVQVGTQIRVEFGHVNTYQGENQLNIGWHGKLIILL